MHFLKPSGKNFITNMKYGVWGWKKSKITFAGLWKCQQKTISQNWLKLAKFKNCVICMKFQCLKRNQMIPKLINFASLNVECYKRSWNNQNLGFWKTSVVAYFPVDTYCEECFKLNFAGQFNHGKDELILRPPITRTWESLDYTAARFQFYYPVIYLTYFSRNFNLCGNELININKK